MDATEHFIAIACLFIAIFGGLLLYVLHVLQKIKRLKNSGNRVDGKIVDISEIGFTDGPMFSAIIEFVTLEGQTICFTSNEGSSTMPIIGDSVVVLYESKKPDEAIEFKTSSERVSVVFAIFFASIVLILLFAILSKAS